MVDRKSQKIKKKLKFPDNGEWSMSYQNILFRWNSVAVVLCQKQIEKDK